MSHRLVNVIFPTGSVIHHAWAFFPGGKIYKGITLCGKKIPHDPGTRIFLYPVTGKKCKACALARKMGRRPKYKMWR